MRGLIFLANGFEDCEALLTRDVLIRSGIEIVTSSISTSKDVTSSFNIHLSADISIDEVDSKDYDFLVLPGGGKGTMNLKESSKVDAIIDEFAHDNKLLCAICAAPSVLGRKGLLKEKRYTCFAGCQEGEGIFTGNEVEIDGNIITARSMAYSLPFALAIIGKLLGNEMIDKVLIGLKGQQVK